MNHPMLVRILTLVATPVLSSPRAEAQQVSFLSADLPLTESAEDDGPDGARQIRRRPRQVLET
jgi:hypothetical protein